MIERKVRTSSFCHYSNNMSTVKVARLKCYKRGETVFERGEIGNEFFIIIKGTVKILGPNKSKFQKIKKIKDEIAEMNKRSISIKDKRRLSRMTKSSFKQSAQGSEENQDSQEDDEVEIKEKNSEIGNDHEKSKDLLIDDAKSLTNRSQSSLKHEDSKQSIAGEKRTISRFSNKESKRGTITTEGYSESMDPFDKLRYLENEPDMILLTKMSNGDSFGEIALINKTPRTATVICETE